jgi:FkbM family methyltransferase
MSRTLKDFAMGLVTPLIRTYIRSAPLALGKRLFWTLVVDPYFAWRPHQFVASTVFCSAMAGNTTDIIQQYIYYFGLWEPDLTYWIQERLAPGDTFVDVGANIGYFSLLAPQLVGESGSVVAIEASPKTFLALKDNLNRNAVRNVRAVSVAVSHSRHVVRLFRGPDSNIGETTFLEGLRLEFECEAEAAPLTAILQRLEIERARLIKIDVEGAEWCVVAGMGPILSSGRADLEIIVEVHPELLARQGKRPADIVRVFSEAGFHAYSLESDYSPLSYLPPVARKRPMRVRTPIDREANVVFSRRDAELL